MAGAVNGRWGHRGVPPKSGDTEIRCPISVDTEVSRKGRIWGPRAPKWAHFFGPWRAHILGIPGKPGNRAQMGHISGGPDGPGVEDILTAASGRRCSRERLASRTNAQPEIATRGYYPASSTIRTGAFLSGWPGPGPRSPRHYGAGDLRPGRRPLLLVATQGYYLVSDTIRIGVFFLIKLL